ncbi:MAG: GNAT family N-acetyltransferase [Acidobacteria bacterium 13_1_20CM_3_53_8]|nr:MAG: GNAT family N-acetyltransferase [Acidobacteria bacterium 13_1_20CM_3_53_8]
MLKLVQAESAEQLAEARKLFLEYAEWLGISLCFQNFDEEVNGLPGKYAPPEGRLLLALFDEKIAGCIALRKICDGVCEMKRLFVKKEFRGKGIGLALARALIEEARHAGYGRMLLDTLPSQMSEAVAMYRSLGFHEIDPYYFNPVEGALFMEKVLKAVFSF